MTKDAVAVMGGFLPEDYAGRDAVHVATFSAKLDPNDKNAYLSPGMPIDLVRQDGDDWIVTHRSSTYVGIVDPFLSRGLSETEDGARFLAFLYPRTITALSHRWSHPVFDGETTPEHHATPAARLASEQWMRAFTEPNPSAPSYDRLVEVLTEFLQKAHGREVDEFLHCGAYDAHGDIPPEFWEHAENIIGLKAPAKKPAHFTCAC